MQYISNCVDVISISFTAVHKNVSTMILPCVYVIHVLCRGYCQNDLRPCYEPPLSELWPMSNHSTYLVATPVVMQWIEKNMSFMKGAGKVKSCAMQTIIAGLFMLPAIPSCCALYAQQQVRIVTIHLYFGYCGSRRYNHNKSFTAIL